MAKEISLYERLEKQDKKFSFVIPVYKTEDFLEKSIKSILEQDYKNVELVVVADGESKEAEKIVKSLQKTDNRIVKYITIEHGGAPKARNEGFKHTTGDYVSFWDSDCFLEIGALRVWAKSFLAFPEISFSYAGYRMSNGMFLGSEDFDPYLLTCYNYIATMFPMKREIFPGFDENLKSLQDWDMWLTITEKGYKGWKNEGAAFVADSTRKGISAEGCSKEVFLERWKAVKDKHGVHRKHAFISTIHKNRAIELAKAYNWDYLDSSRFHLPNDYKTIYCIGFYYKYINELCRGFATAPKESTKILHWMGEDVEGLHAIPYKGMRALIIMLNHTIDKQYCENELCRQMLDEVGIKAEVRPLPFEYKDVPMPKVFNVYYEIDPETEDLMNTVIKACPDIHFESGDRADLNNYACFMSLTKNSDMPSENLKRFLAAGRFAVTNYEMLYAGKVEISRDKVIAKLREYYKQFKKGLCNSIAQTFYKDLISIESFRQKVILGVENAKEKESAGRSGSPVLQCGNISGRLN